MEKNEKLNTQTPYETESTKSLQELNLLDDFLFDVATEDLEACQIMIELSMGITLKSIRWKEGQKVVHNLPGKRGIRMEFCVEDGDGCKKIILNTGGNNDKEVDKTLTDFLHYVENSDEAALPAGCDERLRHLHKKIVNIKSSEEMEVTYMKMQERDRLIREEGENRGREAGKAEGKA